MGGGEIIENPILSNFKEGLSILEYFISTHGARKGLADTALKTADAGYLTRRLVDVSQDAIINIENTRNTLRGINVSALKKNEEIVESLGERILGRVALHDVVDPSTNEVIIAAGEEITDDIVDKITASPIDSVEVRSPLTCEAPDGICVKCYGRNLATNKMVQERRSCWSCCRTIDRRTWNSVDSQNLPRWWSGWKHFRRKFIGIQIQRGCRN